MINKLRMITGESDEQLLSFLLEQAESFILAYTNRTKIIKQLENVKLDLAVIYYNRMGSEGEISRSEGGISVTRDNAPKYIYDVLNSYRMSPTALKAGAEDEAYKKTT